MLECISKLSPQLHVKGRSKYKKCLGEQLPLLSKKLKTILRPLV